MTILTFLNDSKPEYDVNEEHDGVAMWLFKIFMRVPARP